MSDMTKVYKEEPRYLHKFLICAEYRDAKTYLYIGGNNEDECMYEVADLQSQYGDCLWYSGVTNDYYINGQRT